MITKLKSMHSVLFFSTSMFLLTLPTLNAQNNEYAKKEKIIESETKSSKEGLKISGYFQAQMQIGQENASLKVGSGRLENEDMFLRFGIRRGRLKFAYTKGIAEGVFQIDLTEKGLGVKDAYLQLNDPGLSESALKVGVFNRPFGHEIAYSSSTRESPERSQIFQTLFPEERDLGLMLRLQTKKGNAIDFLTLDLGLFAGNGIKVDLHNKKDFIGRISAKSRGDKMKFSGGFSYYNGKVYQGTENIFTAKSTGYYLDSNPANLGKYSKREYVGVDFQYELNTKLGRSYITSEFILGTQAADIKGNKSPNSSILPENDIYNRKFHGGYVSLVHDLKKIPLSAVIKYDWYTPNKIIDKRIIGLADATGIADISYQTIGWGLNWQINKDIRLTAYYDMIKNYKAEHLSGFEKDIKDNILTFRLQYKF